MRLMGEILLENLQEREFQQGKRESRFNKKAISFVRGIIKFDLNKLSNY